jgi:hypothetical protein
MKRFAILALIALTCTACGKSKEQQQAEALQKQLQASTDQLQKGADGLAKGLGDLAAGLAGSNADGNVKPVDPVSFRDLMALLPAPAGWEREKPTGERMTAPVNFADASVRMMKGEATVTAKITDSAFNQLLVAPFTAFLAGNYEHETDRGYEKGIKVGDAPAFEKWDSGTKSGTLTVIAGKRFIVEIDGSSIDSPKVLHDIVETIDLKKLAALQ